jgi:pimeloyl-ACP methyl ester carboxylesterase
VAFLNRDGVRIYYETAGDGPAVLFTHGFAASSHMFTANTAELARDHTVITWDLRGHGRSDYPDDQAAYSPDLAIGDVLALLDALGADRAVIAGHSLGGFLSLKFHHDHPDRVRALMLIDTGPGYRNPDGRDGWNRMAERYATDLEARGLGGLPGRGELSADVHRDASGLIRAARGILVQHDATVIESLPGIEVPTLVIVGEDDQPFLSGSKYMAAKIPNATLAVIPGDHAPNLSSPEIFDSALRDFLDGLPAG